jgi:hypothetical protein
MISHRVGLSTLSVLPEHWFFGSRGNSQADQETGGSNWREGLEGKGLDRKRLESGGFEGIWLKGTVA